MSTELREQLEKCFAGVILFRARDLLGIPLWTLTAFVTEGTQYRWGRGLAGLTSRPVTEHHGLAQAAKRVPTGVICLLSARVSHGLTTQSRIKFGLPWHPKRANRSLAIRL